MRSVAGVATIGVTQIHADLGTVEARITTLDTQLDARKIILTEGFASLENVDAAEAKSRIDNLTTLLQISYSLTSQTRKLSLIDYV